MKKIIKAHLWFLGILFSVSIILVAALPSIISTKSGTKLFVKALEHHFGGTYEVGELHLNWVGTQQASNVKILQGRRHVDVENLSLYMSLFKMIKMRNYPLELVFSGNLRIQNGAVHYNNESSVTQINISAVNESKMIYVTAKTTVPGGEEGSINIIGKQGTPSWEWDGVIIKMPLVFVEFVHEGKYPFRALAGDYQTIVFDYKNSILNLTANCPKLSFKTKGKLEEGTFFLLEPMTIYFMLDQLGSEVLFKDSSVRPISSDQIVFQIQPKNTRFTFFPLHMNSLQISSMTLHLGKMVLKNFGTLSDLLSIMSLQFRPNKDVPIWFQDAAISVEDGIANVSRTEMLVDNTYELGFMGKINLPSKSVDGNLILTAQVLRKVFHLKSVPPSFTVMMRTEGPFSDVQIHKTRALKEIGRVVIAERAKLPVVPTPTNNPPPARQPIPWGNIQ